MHLVIHNIQHGHYVARHRQDGALGLVLSHNSLWLQAAKEERDFDFPLTLPPFPLPHTFFLIVAHGRSTKVLSKCSLLIGRGGSPPRSDHAECYGDLMLITRT